MNGGGNGVGAAEVDVCLVNMPYSSVERPSISLGLLKGALEGTPLTTECVYANLGFAERVGVDGYNAFDSMYTEHLVGEWTFCDALYGSGRPRDGYLDWVVGRIPELVGADADAFKKFVLEVRRLAVDFVADTASAILARKPRIVGCTSMFQQHIASLALLKQIKDRSPATATMIGGANCEGPMGEATHRNFPWVDYVVSGEADDIIVDLCMGVAGSTAAKPYRSPHASVLSPAHRRSPSPAAVGRGTITDMDSLPVPHYDDYFGALKNTSYAKRVRSGVPFEGSRGCWWGAIKHCTFCGLNGGGMVSRVKSTERVLDEMDILFVKHGVRHFMAVDNILSIPHLKTLIPALRSRPGKFAIFFETKANLKRREVQMLADAGVCWIQPGIESLNSDVLKLMRKGVKAWTNVQLLKWSQEFGVRLSWNALAGFPGERDTWYAETSSWIPLVSHLQPPLGNGLVRVDRFSPYHMSPDEWGLKLRPVRSYRSIYPFDDRELDDLAYFFECPSQPDPESVGPGLAAFRERIGDWMAAHKNKPTPVLRYTDDGQRLSVTDSRPVSGSVRSEFRGLAREVLLACDDAPPEALLSGRLPGGGTRPKERIAETVADLVEKKLLLRLDGRVIFLATRPAVRELTMVKSFPSGITLSVPPAAG